jgi:hypothetical protein
MCLDKNLLSTGGRAGMAALCCAGSRLEFADVVRVRGVLGRERSGVLRACCATARRCRVPH